MGIDAARPAARARRGGPPWAGLLAALLVLGADRLVLGPGGPWGVLAGHLEPTDPVAAGVLSDRLELKALARDRDEAVLEIACVGTSRAQRAFRLEALPRRLGRPLVVHRFTHPGLQPFEIRDLADELAEAPPDVVVLLVSGFDTHRPVRLNASTGTGSAAALAELATRVGLVPVVRHRAEFLRLGLSTLWRCYRFRRVLAGPSVLRAGLEWNGTGTGSGDRTGIEAGSGSEAWTWTRDADETGRGAREVPAPAVGDPVGHATGLVAGEPPMAADLAAVRERARRLFPDIEWSVLETEIAQIHRITRGDHVAVQTGLLSSAVAVLRQAGCDVVVVEGPLHPLAQKLHDVTIRDDVLEAMARLAAEHGVEVLTLEQCGPFERTDFVDLTHLGPSGAARIEEALAKTLRRIARRRGL